MISTLKCFKDIQDRESKRQTIREVLQQVIEGVAYMHKHNIWHRDLKPDNIFITNGTYKIGDFGSSCHEQNQDHVGTLDYAAPEILLRLQYDKSVDIWSLGCIAYELDVQKPPFYHPNRTETIRRIVNIEFDESLISDPQLKDLILKMLVRSKEMRITANEALKHEYFMDNHKQNRNRI